MQRCVLPALSWKRCGRGNNFAVHVYMLYRLKRKLLVNVS